MILIIIGLCAVESVAAASEGSIHGAVRTRHGTPVVGATVSIRDIGKKRHIAVKTDKRGAFMVDELPAGSYSVAASYGRWALVRLGVGVEPAIPSRVNFYFDGERPEEAWAGFERVVASSESGRARSGVSLGADAMVATSGEPSFSVLRPNASFATPSAIYTASVDALAAGGGRDDSTLQSGLLGVDIALGERGVAYVRLGGGSQRFDLGSWSTADAGGLWRVQLMDSIAGEAQLGAKTTSLLNDDRGDQWIAEGAFGGRLLLSLPWRRSRLSAGASVHLPLAHSGGIALGREASSTNLRPLGELAPRARFDLELGLEVGEVGGWELHAALARRDRGGGSPLPMLVGGSDQTQVTLGMARRFGGGE